MDAVANESLAAGEFASPAGRKTEVQSFTDSATKSGPPPLIPASLIADKLEVDGNPDFYQLPKPVVPAM